MPQSTLTEAKAPPAMPSSRRPRSGGPVFVVEACERRTLLAASFAPAIQIVTDRLPRETAVADFNGDGLADIATVVPEENEVVILLNNGDGTFRHAERLPASEPRTLTAGDFNNDGHIDLAVYGPDLNAGNGVIHIYDGRADGAFTLATTETHLVTSGPTLVPFDLNGDGLTDLIATTNGRVAVLMSTGNNTFAKAKYYFIGDEPPTDLKVGDFNGDGVPDLAVTRGRLSRIAIFLGKPSAPGTFDAPSFYDTGGNPSSVTLGDFNGDGKLDVAVSNEQFRGNSMAVMLGNGDGTLRPASLYAGASFADRIISGNFSGSGHDDIIVGAFDGSTQLYTNDGTANFAPPTPIQNAQFAQFISAGDFNGDGKADLVVTPYKFIRLLLNTSGAQTPPVLGPGLDQTVTSAAAASFYTPEGTLVTLSIKGPGRAALHFISSQTINVPSGVTTRAVTARTLDSISLSGSTTATTLSARISGGSATLNFNSLTAESAIGMVDMPRANLSTLSLPGGVSAIKLLSGTNGSITIGGTIRPNLEIGAFSNEIVTVTPAINTLQLSQDASGTALTTPSIGRMTVGGGIVNSRINLTATGANDLSSLTMTRGLVSSVINSTGGLGTLAMGSIISSQLLAGVGALQPGELMPTSASEFAANVTIKSITLLAVTNESIPNSSLGASFANASIAAFNMKTLGLGRVQTYNGGTPFGVASHFIASLSGVDLTTQRGFSIKQITSSAIASNTFARQHINPQDLLIRIV